MNDTVIEPGQTGLFAGLSAGEAVELLQCLDAERADYPKGASIIEEGSRGQGVGILCAGRARAVKWDASGRLIIITLLQKGSENGALLAACPGRPSPVTVQALDDSCVLWLSAVRILDGCGRACPRHRLLLRNYLRIVAEKGLVLHERLDCLLRPTIREKVLAYLSRMSGTRRAAPFSIPRDRGAMAEYLNVERSALSRELAHMKRDGILDYHKNTFRLLGDPGKDRDRET